MSDENEETVNALLYERSGYEAALAQAEADDNEEAAAVAKESIAAVNASLKAYGHAAKAPAKRAETRPAKGATKR